MIVAQYRGNSSPGQLVDSSGNGYDLTVIGTSVPNPSSPTPPEGDRWLVGPSVDGVSYLLGPGAVGAGLNTRGSVTGYFNTSLGTEPGRDKDDILASFNDAVVGIGTKFLIVLDSTGPFGQVRIYFIQVSPSLVFADYFFADVGSDHTFEVLWTPSGTELYIDSLLVASSSSNPTIPTDNITISGLNFGSMASDYTYMDDFIFTYNPDFGGKGIETGNIDSGDIDTGNISGGSIG